MALERIPSTHQLGILFSVFCFDLWLKVEKISHHLEGVIDLGRSMSTFLFSFLKLSNIASRKGRLNNTRSRKGAAFVKTSAIGSGPSCGSVDHVNGGPDPFNSLKEGQGVESKNTFLGDCVTRDTNASAKEALVSLNYTFENTIETSRVRGMI